MLNKSAFDALLIGGRSGSGKSSLGFEVSSQLQSASVAHCFIEGDFLDQAFPAPSGDPSRTLLTEDNLAALWRNFSVRGYHRLIYSNTVSVLEADLVRRAMAREVRFVGVLLTADDATVRQRLEYREVGSQLEAHIARSAAMAEVLEAKCPPWVIRVPTDGRDLIDIAGEVIELTGWKC